MAHTEIVEYIKRALAQDHELSMIKAALLEQGWPSHDVEEATLVATAPVVPPTPPVHEVVDAPTPTAVAPQPVVKKTVVAEHYTSPLSVLLALLLFVALSAFTSRFTTDITNIVAPYAGSFLEGTPIYRNLLEKGQAPLAASSQYSDMRIVYEARHKGDESKLMVVNGVISMVFWVLAFALHFSFGQRKRQFLVLSLPYFFVAGLYLLQVLMSVFAQLFSQDAKVAIYATLILIIVGITTAFVFYQKHTKKPQSL